MRKFYEFKNITDSSADLYLYGEIVQEKSTDFWTGKESETEVSIMDFKNDLENLDNISKLNIFINSPGGDVFVASAMASMLQRKKIENNVTIDAYVDGISASAASFLMCVANNIYLYKNSVVMIHKPMSFAYGNSNDLQKTIDTLDKLENATMIPLYMKKAKIDEDQLRQFISDETWFSAEEMEKYFNVIVLDDEKTAVASINNELFKKYNNIPENIKTILNSSNKQENITAGLDTVVTTAEAKIQTNSIDLSNSKDKDIKARLSLIEGFLIAENMKDGD